MATRLQFRLSNQDGALGRLRLCCEAMSDVAARRDPRRALGQAAEDRAAAYLEQSGYTVLARNWRSLHGELDIVARDGKWLVFVEVRARRGDRFGSPEESVTRQKQARLAALAEAYVAECGWEGPWRIDVVAMHYRGDGTLIDLSHLQDAVGGL